MARNYIKYPIAFNKLTEKLVNISDATNHNKANLICLECKESFIAVLNHQTPHYKHKPNSKCKGDVESYIHWVTKEVFKELTEIELPEIYKYNLSDSQIKKLNNQVNKLIEHDVPKTLHPKFRKSLKKNLSESGKFQIEKIETEKEFNTSLGNVRIDIVTTIKNQKLFIEPFFTNPIDDFKKRKLVLINTPTLSINLLAFIYKFNYNYNLENLKNYLISKNSKNWVFNRVKQTEKYVSEYLKYVKEEIKKNKDNFDTHLSKLKKIVELETKVNVLEERIRPIQDKIWETRDEMRKIKKKIGIKDYDF